MDKPLQRTTPSPATITPATLALAAVTLAALMLPPPARAQSNAPDFDAKAAVIAMHERAWSRGEVEAFDTLVADSIRFHYNGAPRTMTRRQLADGVLAWRAAFADLRMETLDLVAEGDLVAGRLLLTGTHRGPWRGAEPTGERVEMPLMVFFRFDGGRLVELWEVDDQLGFQRQLGLIR